MEHGTWLALIPPFTAIILCFLTKRVLESLFAGIFAGALILSGYNPLQAINVSLDTIVSAVSDEGNIRLLMFNMMVGAGIAFIWRLNGSRAITAWASERLKTRKGTSIGIWLLGMIVFFNDYCNAAIVGNVSREISKDHRISTEKLSYILDSTSAPVSTFFISDWIAFQIGMIAIGLSAAGIDENTMNPIQGFFYSIPLNIYCLLAVLFVGMVCISGRDFGPMYKAEKRALETGEVVRKKGTSLMDIDMELGDPVESAKPRLRNFFMPIATLVVVTLFVFFYFAYKSVEGEVTLRAILDNADANVALLWGAFFMAISGIVLAVSQKIMSVKVAVDTVVDGMKLMMMACLILILAWSMGEITSKMHLSQYIVDTMGSSIPGSWLPIAIFLVGMLVSFATGTSWGTMTILTPIAIPLAYNIYGDPKTAVMMSGIVFSGAIFGDHCSPISDTTVLSSIFSGADHIDHVASQMPYALTIAVISGLLFILYGFFGLSPFILIPIGVIMALGVLMGIGKKVQP